MRTDGKVHSAPIGRWLRSHLFATGGDMSADHWDGAAGRVETTAGR